MSSKVERRDSWKSFATPKSTKMTHAESAHLCTEAVIAYQKDGRQNKEALDKKCAAIRKTYFDQYRVTG
jgi:hypothetical protein